LATAARTFSGARWAYRSVILTVLQRRLAEADKIYSDLVQQVRFEAAAQMLKDSDIKIIDITYELGYEDPSNFARAFWRIAGVSPREYRENNCAM